MTAGSPMPRPESAPMPHRIVLNARHMPSYSYGHRSPIWWGTLGFAAAEGMGFVMVIGAYFYLVFINGNWPLSAPPPDLLWSSLFTILVLASGWPNYLAKRAGEREDLAGSRRTLVIMSLIGVVLLGIRIMEFTVLHVRWDQNAYGSILWVILGLHTLHLVTDLGDTIVLTVLMFTRHGHGKRFSDVGDNAFYWYFVVGAWVPIYVILYWFPRWG